MSDDADVLIVGSGAGGGTLAHRLAPSGRSILILERGDWPPPDDQDVEFDEPPNPTDKQPFRATGRYHVGGATTRHTTSFSRLREQDFRRLRHRGGVSPAWPIEYDDLEPYYTQAERLYKVHGTRGEDPSEPPAQSPYPYPAHPFSRPTQDLSDALVDAGLHPFHVPSALLCQTARCRGHLRADTRSVAVLPALTHSNVTLIRHARVERIETNPSGRLVTSVMADVDGASQRFKASVVVLSAGASNSAVLLLSSSSNTHPRGLANGSDLVGRNILCHNERTLAATSEPRSSRRAYLMGVTDYYFGDDDFEYPMGSAELVAGSSPRSDGHPRGEPRLAARLISEGLPDPGNRVVLTAGGRTVLRYVPNNPEPLEQLHHRLLSHLRQVGAGFRSGSGAPWRCIPPPATVDCVDGAGTARFGKDAATSVLDTACKAHELDNLYVVDSSFLPSIGAVDPALTVMANALRVGDHLLTRFGWSQRDPRLNR